MRRCRHCDTPLDPGRRADAVFCDHVCAERARRRRHRRLPESLPAGGRGPLRLGQPSRVEQLEQAAYERGRQDGLLEGLTENVRAAVFRLRERQEGAA